MPPQTVSQLVQQPQQVDLLMQVQQVHLSEHVHQEHTQLVPQDFGAVFAHLVFYMLQVPPQLPVLLLLQDVQFMPQQQLAQHANQVSTLLAQQIVQLVLLVLCVQVVIAVEH